MCYSTVQVTQLEPVLTVSEVAKRLRVCLSTVWKMLRAGTLKGHRIGSGREWRILERDLTRYQNK